MRATVTPAGHNGAMPFLDADGRPLDRVPLLYRGGRLFQLLEPVTWQDPRDGSRRRVAAHDPSRPASDEGNSTDLASVPPFLWGLVASYGRQSLPAILHDGLDDQAAAAPPAERAARRRAADDDFRVALGESGVTDLRAMTMWAAVVVQGTLRFAPARGVLLLAHTVVAAAACVAAVVLAVTGHPAWLALLAAPSVTSLIWMRDARAAMSAAYLAALYLPLIVAALALSAIEYIVALVVWLARGRPGSRPTPGPTLR